MVEASGERGLIFIPRLVWWIVTVIALFNATPQPTIEAASQGAYPQHSRYWSVTELLELALSVGFSGSAAVTAVSICLAESGGFDGATGYNAPTPECPNGSLDRGLMQINSCSHSEVSDYCAYDGTCAFKEAYRISLGGAVWWEWATYNDNSYLQYYDSVKAAYDEMQQHDWEVDP